MHYMVIIGKAHPFTVWAKDMYMTAAAQLHGVYGAVISIASRLLTLPLSTITRADDESRNTMFHQDFPGRG